MWLMRKTGVHREDGVHAPWDVVAQTDRKVGQFDERQPRWPVPTTTLAGGAERKTGMPVWRTAPPA